MSLDPILLIGGYGIAGRATARLLRAAHSDVPLLIGGRDLAKGNDAAAAIGSAEGVRINLNLEDLGIGERPVSAVATFLNDASIAGLRFAQARGVPHIGISSAITEMGPEVAAYVNNPTAAPVVLGTEWLVGATTVPTLELIKPFGEVHSITIGALIDEEDTGGPAAIADMERVINTMPAALARRNGAYFWRVGDDAVGELIAVDGTLIEAAAFSAYDVVGLAAATGAPNVQFNLASGVTSSRRRGGSMTTEIIIELAGTDHDGRPLRTRHAIVHDGQMVLTGLGVAMVLERLLGLDGRPAVPAGLYFPYQLLEPAAYLARLKESGGVLLELEVL